MLRTILLASALAAGLATGASALEFTDEGTPLSALAPSSPPAVAAEVEWSAVPALGYLATEGGYIRVVEAERASSNAAVEVSSLPEPGFFADESGYIRSVDETAEFD